MPNPEKENPRLNEKSGKKPRNGHDNTPPHKGDPEQVENVPGREQLNPHKGPDPDETYRQGNGRP